MCDSLIKATEKDFAPLTQFYRHAVENTEDMGRYARWVYGRHPTDEMILGYIKSGNMYFIREEGAVAAAVAVVPYQGVEYHDAAWDLEVKDDEVSVVHILCVAPEFQGRGLAGKLMRRVAELSRQSGKKAIRLDAMACNIPARHLYESLGFVCADRKRWHTDNAGWTDFLLYELRLSAGTPR